MNGFVGEFLILDRRLRQQRARRRARVYTAVAATGVILSAVYMLWMFQRVNYGPVTNDKNRGLRDLSVREWCVIAPICAMAIVMGVVPGVFLKPMEPAVRKTVEQIVRQPAPANAPASDRAAPIGSARRSPDAADVGRHRRDGGRRRPRRCADRHAERHHPHRSGPHRRAVGVRRAAGRGVPPAGRAGCPSAGSGVIGLVGGIVDVASRSGTATPSASASSSLDNYTIFFNVTICAIGLLTILISSGTAERDHLPTGEYYALMLFSLVGHDADGRRRATCSSSSSRSRSCRSASTCMTGLKRTSEQGAEAAFKYFVLGAFSSAFFLYGIAFAYAVAGTTQARRARHAHRRARRSTRASCVMLAMVLLLVGFAFKVSAVPFHMWTPDAYQGAPTLVTGLHVHGRQGGGVRGVRARVPVGARAAARRLAAGASRRSPA